MRRIVSTITLAAAALLLAASAQAADKKYDEGASDTEVKLGQTMPYSGPLSIHGTFHATALKRSKRNASRSRSGRSLVRFGKCSVPPSSRFKASSIGPSF